MRAIRLLTMLVSLGSVTFGGVLPTKAAPPEPNINPIHATIMTIGKIRFTPANSLLPAKLEMKNPSTIQ